MGITVWFFLEHADGGLRRVPSTWYRAFFDGSVATAASHEGAVRIVQVIAQVAGRRIEQVLRVSPVLHHVTGAGFVDAGHRERGMRLAVASIDFLSTDTVAHIEPHLARRERATTHAWQPTPEQLQQLANALNQAAARPPVVVITAACVSPADDSDREGQRPAQPAPPGWPGSPAA